MQTWLDWMDIGLDWTFGWAGDLVGLGSRCFLDWAGLGFHQCKRFGFVGGWIFGWIIQLVRLDI